MNFSCRVAAIWLCLSAIFTPAPVDAQIGSISYPPEVAYRPEFLWRFPILRSEVSLALGRRVAVEGLTTPELGQSRRAALDWNVQHPLMAVPELPRAPFAGVSIDSNAVLVAQMSETFAQLDPKDRVYAGWIFLGARLSPFAPWDYKRNPRSYGSRAAKNFGNVNAGAQSELMGVPPWLFDWLADRVQNLQNAGYWWQGTGERGFWGIFGGDEPEGQKYVQIGRDWTNAMSYRSFHAAMMLLDNAQAVEEGGAVSLPPEPWRPDPWPIYIPPADLLALDFGHNWPPLPRDDVFIKGDVLLDPDDEMQIRFREAE